jgi:cobalt-zinc-cadmium efflux system membrane fusion protein
MSSSTLLSPPSGAKRVAALIALAAVATATFVVFGDRSDERVAVEPGAIARQIVARAVIVPEEGVARVAGPPGQVRKLHVQVGDVVGRGVVLAVVEQAGKEHEVVAPIAASVIAVHAAKGDDVAPGAPLFELADLERLEVRIEVEAEHAPAVVAGQAVVLRPLGGGDAIAQARLARVAPLVGARSIGLSDARVRAEGRVVAAFARLPPGTGLKLGHELEAVIALGDVAVAARLPHAAVHIEDGRAVVRLPGRLYDTTRVVGLGQSDEHWVEVFDLAPGTMVRAR